MTFEPVRSDTLPENTRYVDDGCEASESCLTCPLPMCKFDDPGWMRREDRGQRDDEIFRLRKAGISVPELARQFRVSTRTVHRIIQRGGCSETATVDADRGPALSLQELAERSIIRRRPSLPSLSLVLRRSA
ncbi:MAG: helix-turn-helix domain containing protein [Chloroflexi bacterium]|nr:helix-turn-helix domain containing protein [Chloroflexota bacterium]